MTDPGTATGPAGPDGAPSPAAGAADRIVGLGGSPPEGALEVTVEGSLPTHLRGAWWSNGPAVFTAGTQPYRHWLDGDGWVLRVSLADGRAEARGALVDTRKRREEAARGRAVFRAFGTAFEGDRLVLGRTIESPANISVAVWAGRVLALGEQGLPYELDAVDLSTLDRFTFGRSLNEASPLAAHTHVDPATGELVAFGVSFSATRPTLTLYQVATDLRTRRHRVDLPWPASIHDFALTPEVAVFWVAPYVLEVERFVEGGSSVLDALRWRPELGARLLVIDRHTGETVHDLPMETAYCLHLANAHHRGADLVVDLLELDRPVYPHYRLAALYRDAPVGRPVRWIVDASGSVTREAHDELEASLDFPALPGDLVGRATDRIWYLAMADAAPETGSRLFDRLVHLDWGTGSSRVLAAPDGWRFAGEPALDEAGRTVLVPLSDGGRTELWVLPADLEGEALARVVGAGVWPHRFHSVWAPAGVGGAPAP